jgi:hypothetical protein
MKLTNNIYVILPLDTEPWKNFFFQSNGKKIGKKRKRSCQLCIRALKEKRSWHTKQLELFPHRHVQNSTNHFQAPSFAINFIRRWDESGDVLIIAWGSLLQRKSMVGIGMSWRGRNTVLVTSQDSTWRQHREGCATRELWNYDDLFLLMRLWGSIRNVRRWPGVIPALMFR